MNLTREKNKKPSVQRRPPPWPQATLYKAHRPAIAVNAALWDLANGCVAHVSREQLSAQTGMKDLDAISKALTFLETAGWIKRRHSAIMNGEIRTGTVLQIWLRRPVGNSCQKKSAGNKHYSQGRTGKSTREVLPSDLQASLEGTGETARGLTAKVPVRVPKGTAADSTALVEPVEPPSTSEKKHVGASINPSEAPAHTKVVSQKDPLTGASVSIALIQARGRKDDAEVARLNALIRIHSEQQNGGQ